jgi:uncharacterized membrane protein
MSMGKNRLEAFSDGVLAIVITIMVLEMKVPHHGARFSDLVAISPVFASYVMSFLYLAIYWNNHHHLMQAARTVSGAVLWANMHLLFWLSLVPFVTGWMGENRFAPAPTALYGFVLLMAGIAYRVLQQRIVRVHGRDSVLAHALGRDRKGLVSVLCYAAAIPLAYLSPWISGALYLAVALLWLVPDRRIERALEECAID